MCVAGAITRFALADVSGHGASAGELADTLRRLMRKHINTPDQTRLARALNGEFSALEASGRFATALLGTYFAPTDHFIVCNAGHPRPLWWRAYEEEWTFLEPGASGVTRPDHGEEVGVADLPLGIIEPTAYRQFAAHLGRGDLIVAYTDGLSEAADASGRQLGEEGLLAVAREFDPSRPELIGPGLLARATAHRGGSPPEDDLTLMVLHHNAAEPPGITFAERVRILGRVLGLVKD
jgi:serine phosphatase RsbU (regulator of sigma subunit)